MTVRIDIGEIVLHGVAVEDAGAFRTALTSELAALAAAGGTGDGRLADREVGSLRAPGIEAAPDTLARDVAGSVWRAVSAGGGKR